MIRRVEICRTTVFLELKRWSKLASKEHTSSEVIFRNRHPVSTGALFLEVPGAKKLRQNWDFLQYFLGVDDGGF